MLLNEIHDSDIEEELKAHNIITSLFPKGNFQEINGIWTYRVNKILNR